MTIMHQLTQLTDDVHRQQLAHARHQRPAQHPPAPGRDAHRAGCVRRAAQPARTIGARLRRVAAVLAAVACALLAWAAAAPAAFATPTPLPPPGGPYGPATAVPVPATIIRVVTTGGMAGWQITLIAAGAALAAAATVMLIYRPRASRPMQNVPAPATAPASGNPGLSGSDQIQFLSGTGPGQPASEQCAHNRRYTGDRQMTEPFGPHSAGHAAGHR
jgi:hypothetical protein